MWLLKSNNNNNKTVLERYRFWTYHCMVFSVGTPIYLLALINREIEVVRMYSGTTQIGKLSTELRKKLE